jgi:hypothetical protein
LRRRNASRLTTRGVHSGRPFKCDQCTADYKTKAHLKGHIKSKHEGVRHDCEYCNKSYPNLQDLQKHIAKFHP